MGVVTPTILSGGRPIDPAFALLSIDIRKEVNRIPVARMVFVDGDAARRRFAMSDDPCFELGGEVEVRARYEGSEDATLFKGVVVRHGIDLGEDCSMLTIEAKDAAVKLTQCRKSSVFRNMTDDAVIGKLIEDAGLRKGSLPVARPTHAEIVQYYATDWDFILSRADVQGLLVLADDGKVSLEQMGASGDAAHALEWGIDEIYDFEIEADGGSQFSSVESLGWDLKTRNVTRTARAKTVRASQGNQDGEDVAGKIGFGPYTLAHPAPMADEELQAWADARMARSRLAMIRGRIAVPGSAAIKPLEVLELKGVGARFNGKALITGARHRIDADGWRTDVRIGLSPEWLCRMEQIEDAPAAGLLPAVSGLQVGIIDKFEEDPDKEYRIKVILPGFDERQGAVWARLASPDAGKDRGWLFRPEPGDEVVVGFFNNDPRQAVVLGAMFGSVNTPPKDFSTLSKENIRKAIVTKKGVTISFSDNEKASLVIKTPASSTITIDDDAREIRISDQHGGAITMDKDGIVLKSAKDVKIDAAGNVEIKGRKVDIR